MKSVNQNKSFLEQGTRFISACLQDQQLCCAFAFACVGIFLANDYSIPVKLGVAFVTGTSALLIRESPGLVLNEFVNTAAAKAMLGR